MGMGMGIGVTDQPQSGDLPRRSGKCCILNYLSTIASTTESVIIPAITSATIRAMVFFLSVIFFVSRILVVIFLFRGCAVRSGAGLEAGGIVRILFPF